MSGLSIRAIFVLSIEFEKNTISIINFMILYFGLHSFNALFYLHIDQNLKNFLINKLEKIKVIVFIQYFYLKYIIYLNFLKIDLLH